jgi:DNA polymerase-3 subunit gamma/tau
MVFYRKYRPQTIAELDSEELRTTLTSILSSASVPHAFLFTGPKGLGKTSTARIVAKVLNCENLTANKQQLTANKKEKKLDQKLEVTFLEPCNQCNQCISITNGSNIDILEIDGASNRGIDEIRDLREKARLSPAAATKKVYIIDEVHMLTTEAFNALLKTLEEPPSHVVFVLCTTEVHKVPATILSRCNHVSFSKATGKELLRTFKRICEKENLSIDDDVLLSIATRADGSFRDGVKTLEELLVKAAGKKITKELVEEMYHVSSITQYVSEIIDSFVKKDAKISLKLISQLVEQGIDIKFVIEQIVDQLMHQVHELLLGRIDIGKDKPALSPYDSIRLIKILNQAYGEIKYAVLPQLPLELAVIEWSVSKEGKKIAVEVQPLPTQPEKTETVTARVKVQNSTTSDDLWPALIAKVKLQNHSIAGVLRGCKMGSFLDGTFTIETTFSFHKEKLSDSKAQELLESVLQEITGNKTKVMVVLRKS